MCGVTNELLKPDGDPRKVLKLAEQLRVIALTRAKEGQKHEARISLRQASFDLARLLIDVCIALLGKLGLQLTGLFHPHRPRP